MAYKKSSGQAAYELVKDAIINRKLAPGTQLIESTIAEKLGISRTPVRSALKRLCDEGLIKIVINKGAFVTQPTIEEIEQAYAMRIELELIAAKWVISNAMDDEITNLKMLVDREEYAVKNRDILEYININKEFHLVLAGASNNKFLLEYIEKIIDKINVFSILYDVFYEDKLDNFKSIKDHLQIIDCIKKKDRDMLETLIKQHLNRSFHTIKINRLGYKKIEDLF